MAYFSAYVSNNNLKIGKIINISKDPFRDLLSTEINIVHKDKKKVKYS